MSIKPPLTDLPIKTADSGFYKGFNTWVTVTGKVLVVLFVLWALIFPLNAISVLKGIQVPLMNTFGSWYIFVVSFFVLVSLGLALWPTTGRIRLGVAGEKPEFSFFSWIAMMFSAGLGIGVLTYATAEPIYHFKNNPDVIQGFTHAQNVDNLMAAYKWSFFHNGISAWACYSIVGLSLAYFSFRRGLPLTMRTGIASIFGKHLSGFVGNAIDVASIIATILGVAVTLGIGIGQFASGLHQATGWDWMIDDKGLPVATMVVVSAATIMCLSTLSAISGVGKGIKWLSNLNMSLSIFLLLFFLVMGSTLFSGQMFFGGLVEYLKEFPKLMFTSWDNPTLDAAGNVVKDGIETQLSGWQAGWTKFYWAWWIAFAPFVGLFIARISRGRTIREFVFGVIIVPSLVFFAWFAIAGGTALDLEISGKAGGAILNAPETQQLYESIKAVLADMPTFAWLMTIVVVVMLLTYLVTSVDSAILVINTINAAGDPSRRHPIHIIIWGAGFGLIMISMLLLGSEKAGGAGGSLPALKSAMIIGAFPFSIVMFLMCVATIKSAIRDGIREKAGEPTTFDEDGSPVFDPDMQ